MHSHSLFYVTCADMQEARHIASALLAEHIIACANILPQMLSLYHWQGKPCESQEVVLLLKSQHQYANRIMSQVAQLHSYDTPCILEIPIQNGHAAFLDWVDATLAPLEGDL